MSSLDSVAPGLVRAAETAAVAAAAWRGKGAEKEADRAAVDAMRKAFEAVSMDGTVVIGEGERDEAPMLFIGEKVGKGEGPVIDIAVDPLEGTTICAQDAPGALAVLAAAGQGGLLHAPDVYMEKIAVGPGLPEGIIDLDDSPAKNLQRAANALGREVEDLVVCILDRPRHEEQIALVRETGARLRLIGDGDVAAVIAVAEERFPIDVYMGTGGAPEGVLAAAALACTGGQMLGRLVFRDNAERERGRKAGIEDLGRIYTRQDLASGDVLFVAAGVTDGPLLRGICSEGSNQVVEALVLSAPGGDRRHTRTVLPQVADVP